MDISRHYDECYFLCYNECTDISIYEIGCQKCPPLYHFGPTIREHYVLHYVLDGKGTLDLNDHKYMISGHQGFIIPPNVISRYQADSEHPWNYIWIHLDGYKVAEYLNRAGITKNQPVFSPTVYENPIASIMQELLLNNQKELYCIGKIYELFECILEFSSTKTQVEMDQKLQYVQKIVNYIRLKYSLPIRVDDMAQALGLNRSYLTRLFKEATGLSPREYLFAYRMKMACNMLRKQEIPIQHIAYAVGYSDCFTFSKAFKRYMKMSPSEYKSTSQTASSFQQQETT